MFDYKDMKTCLHGSYGNVKENTDLKTIKRLMEEDLKKVNGVLYAMDEVVDDFEEWLLYEKGLYNDNGELYSAYWGDMGVPWDYEKLWRTYKNEI